MVAMIMESMASLSWLFVLLIGLLYTFDIIITQGAKDWRALHALESVFLHSSYQFQEVSAGPR